MVRSKVLFVIPAYNEENNILETYKQILKYNKKYKTNYDAIVINDGSTDNTELVCLKNKIPYITLIHNLGIGGAVQTGYKYALKNNYDVVIQFDGDGQHDIKYADKLINTILIDNYDMVIGSRFIDISTSKFQSSRVRRFGINVISMVIKLITGKKIYDTTSGFRAINHKLLLEFSKNYPVEYPEPISIVNALKQGYLIKEVSVSMNERKNGVSSIRTWKSIYYMINVILSIILLGIDGEKNDI